ncbi:MAG: tRNA pseudouridine(55) synthase TruB [Pseudomonadota bacterium]|jgi:tRNA pseudouridine55 synthase
MRVDGVFLLDKAAGASSNRALQQVRRLYGADKAGHTGTLDPFATGLLPICLGEATKFSQVLLESDKVYRATARLGEATDTGDCEGAVIARDGPLEIDQARIDAVLAGLVGALEQVPPMYSALKHQGQPLYRIARAGGEVERAPRTVRIHSLARTAAWRWPDLEFEVCASKGTYVRTLAEQIAAELGTVAHLVALRRIATGRFRIEASHGIDSLEGASADTRARWLLPPDALVADLPAVVVDDEGARRLMQGREISAGVLPIVGGVPGAPLRAYHGSASGVADPAGPGGEFLGLVTLTTSGSLRVQRLMATGQAARDSQSA